MNASAGFWPWLAVRASAVILAFAVVVHLATIIYAVRGGLSAAEILARTEGNAAWLVFYVTFALAAAVHAALGLRTIVSEHTRWHGPGLDVASGTVALGLAGAGTVAALGLY